MGLGLDVRRRRVKEQAGVSLPKAHSRVDTDDFMKVGAEAPPKIPRPRIVGTKLILEGIPWDQAWPPEVAHPVGEPDVEIDRQWRALQLMDGWEIEGYGGASDFLEELAAEDELWSPSRRSPLEARLEELESGIAGRDQAVTALLRSEIL